MVTEDDVEIVYQSHLYKIRVVDRERVSPFLLLALLSSAPVQRQIRASRQTQDIIDSLGDRITQLTLPIPRKRQQAERVAELVRSTVEARLNARRLSRKAIEALLSQGLPNSPMAGAQIRVASGNFIAAKPIGVLDGVEEVYAAYGSGMVEDVLTRWRDLNVTLGRFVEVRAGDRVVEGTALDIDGDGALLVAGPDGQAARVLVGDVTILAGGGRP
jgi:type I restriction enzyme M protein